MSAEAYHGRSAIDAEMDRRQKDMEKHGRRKPLCHLCYGEIPFGVDDVVCLKHTDHPKANHYRVKALGEKGRRIREETRRTSETAPVTTAPESPTVTIPDPDPPVARPKKKRQRKVRGPGPNAMRALDAQLSPGVPCLVGTYRNANGAQAVAWSIRKRIREMGWHPDRGQLEIRPVGCEIRATYWTRCLPDRRFVV